MLEELTAWDEAEFIGELRGLRRAMFTLGQKRFGVPDPMIKTALESFYFDDLERLDRMIVRVAEASSWEDLLGDFLNPADFKKVVPTKTS